MLYNLIEEDGLVFYEIAVKKIATCKNSDSSVNQDILVATIVRAGGDVEVVLYGAFTGSCTLRR